MYGPHLPEYDKGSGRQYTETNISAEVHKLWDLVHTFEVKTAHPLDLTSELPEGTSQLLIFQHTRRQVGKLVQKASVNRI